MAIPGLRKRKLKANDMPKDTPAREFRARDRIYAVRSQPS